MNDDLKLGEKIYEIMFKNPNLKFMNNAKQICAEENKARRSYWAYMFLIKCGLKEYLEKNKKEHILNDYPIYKLLNYIILFRKEVTNEFDIPDSFKKYFIELFLKTHNLPERELRVVIKSELAKKTESFKELELENKRLKNTISDLNNSLIEETQKTSNVAEELSRINKEFHNVMQHKEELRLISNKIYNLTMLNIAIGIGLIINIINIFD